MRLIQPANMKLGKNIMMFNIPASKEVCGRVCEGCYSHKAYRIYPNVLPAQERRLEASKQPDFAARITAELGRLRSLPKYFRIHASAGEFYSQDYVNAWCEIVRSNPAITFYAYTKRLTDFNFTKLGKLSNMVLIDSLLFGDINYGKKEDVPKGAFICPAQKGKITCGIQCTWCMTKGKADTQGVFFLRH